MFAKPLWILSALAGAAVVSVQAAPLAKLDVRLAVATPVLRGDVDVLVDVTVTNPTRHALAVPASTLPSDDPEAKLFAITRDGQPVRYQGAIVKRAPAQANEMVLLEPGASLSYQVELTGAYDLSQDGRYSIEYVGLAKHGGAGANNGAPLYLWLEERSAKGPPAPPPTGGGMLGYTGNCSASQQGAIASAVQSALGYSNQAVGYLGARASATPRYTTWFGAFRDGSGWVTARSHFVAIADAFASKPITVDCKCKKANIYAYVYPTQPYKIYVCGAFWSAPPSGTDSKAGTLIHEMSHFNVVASTDDWAYGQNAARSLANSDPTKALDNADSHEYFAENTPFQP